MSYPAQSLTPGRRLELILLFGVLTVFTPFAVDMYMPAFPAIAREFHTPIAAVEHSLAAYFLGLTIGQAAVGPLSDRFGRRYPLMIGLALFVLGSVACALAPNPWALDLARFIQACGGCTGTVLARSCVRDIFAPDEAARIFAHMLLIISVSPLFAPLFGGWLLLVASWRMAFWIQAGLALAALLAIVLRLPESHGGSAERRLHPLAVLKDYGAILINRHFFGYVMAITLASAGLYVYLTGWAHVVIDIYGIRPQYFGFTFLLNGLGLIVSSQATARLLRHRPAHRLLRFALIAQAGAGAMALLFGLTGWGGLFGLLPWLFLYCALVGAVNPTGSGLALTEFGQSAGMASALMGILMYGGGTLASLVMGAFTVTSPAPMAALICLCGLAGLAVNLFATPKPLPPDPF